MSDEIIVKKKKKEPATITERTRPDFGPMSMWKEMDTIFDAFRNQFDNHIMHPFRPLMVRPILDRRTRLPAMDFKEKDDSYILSLEIPGVPKEDIEISLTATKIEIKADTTEVTKEEGECYVCQERRSRSFDRVFEFPEEIVPDTSEATVEHGVLTIILPKKVPEPNVEARKLEIK